MWLFRLLFRGLKWIGGEVVSSAIVSSMMSQSPQYEITQQYPTPEQYQTQEQKERYYESKFDQIVEAVTAEELKGHFFGDIDNSFRYFNVTDAVAENDTVFFRYYLVDEKTAGITNNGYLVNQTSADGSVKSIINFRYKNFTDVGIYKAECKLNNKKYLLIASSQKNIALLSDETK